jgi:hypothetical protein
MDIWVHGVITGCFGLCVHSMLRVSQVNKQIRHSVLLVAQAPDSVPEFEAAEIVLLQLQTFSCENPKCQVLWLENKTGVVGFGHGLPQARGHKEA